jgi:ABC-2 type transport system ATP-binding protein
MNGIIEISNLNKSFGSIKAVNDLSLEINSGEMFGLVGPDGAGKTTIIKILCGLIDFDSGNVSLMGKDIRSKRKLIQNKIGYLSQKFSLYRDLSVDENIEFFADIHNVSDYRERRDELLEFTRLKNFRKRLADRLSGGMKQKLALACSLIHRPQILFLDEPTTGVDPVSRRDFWKILSNLISEGITVVMSTPYLDEAERCTRVAMMNQGKIVTLDKPRNLKESIGKDILEIVCAPARQAFRQIREKTEFDVQLFGDRINIIVNNSFNETERIKRQLEESNIEIKSTRMVSPSLENVFIYKIKEAG